MQTTKGGQWPGRIDPGNTVTVAQQFGKRGEKSSHPKQAHRHCNTSKTTPTPSKIITSSDRRRHIQENYYVTKECATKGAAKVTHQIHRYYRTADKTRTRQTTKGGYWPGRQDLGDTATSRWKFEIRGEEVVEETRKTREEGRNAQRVARDGRQLSRKGVLERREYTPAIRERERARHSGHESRNYKIAADDRGRRYVKCIADTRAER